mmetsp:Transcript_1801/g.5370  ORF Transcript_1801/g.5370 Transcript_1801/m.5370 type:complete len:438 (+) Transcript_1801:3103-4416(+)
MVAFRLFEFRRFCRLMRVEKILEMVAAHRHGLRVRLLFGDGHGAVKVVQLLVHRNRLVDAALVQQSRLGLLGVAHEQRERRPDAVVVHAQRGRLGDGLVEAVEVARAADVAQSGGATFGDLRVLAVQRHFLELSPHAFGLWRQLQRLQDIRRFVEQVVVDGRAELDQSLVEQVRRSRKLFVDDDLGSALGAFDVFNVAADLVHRDLVRRVDVVPDTERAAVLRHDHVRVGHPLHVGAVVQERRALLRLDFVQVELPPFVPEEEHGATRVQLEPVDLRVLRNGRRRSRDEVAHRDGLGIQKVRNLFVLQATCRRLALRVRLGRRGEAFAALVEAHGQQVARDVVRADGAERLVDAVLHERELAGAVDDAARRIVENKLLLAPVGPLHLAELVRLQIAEEERLLGLAPRRGRAVIRRVGDDVPVLEDVDLGDLQAEERL